MVLLQALDDHKKQALIIKAACFFWLLTKLITYKAWIADRLLPTVGIFRFLDEIPSMVHLLVYIMACTALAAFMLSGRRLILAIAVIAEISACMLDVLRLQPWEYLYLFIAVFYVVSKNRPQLFLAALILLLSSTYIFSGLHKISGAYLNKIWESLILHGYFGIRNSGIILHYAGLLLPIAELFLGFGLLIFENKRWVAKALIIMHISILLWLGPTGLNINYSIWPWNLCMITIHALLSVYRVSALTLLKDIPTGALVVLMLFWLVLPASNLFGYWGHYLSSGMYTGKGATVSLCFTGTKENKGLEPYLSGPSKRLVIGNGKTRIFLSRWTEGETGVMPFPQFWYYKRILDRARAVYPDSGFRMYYTVYKQKEIIEIR